MPDTIIVTIPATPDRCLTPNAIRSERHWGPRSRATKQARGDAFYATMCELGKNQSARTRKANSLTPPLVIHAVIAWEKVRTPRYPNGRYRQMMDPDNAHASLKPFVDGVADALGINDKHITLATVQQERDEAGAGFVRMAIRDCGSNSIR